MKYIATLLLISTTFSAFSQNDLQDGFLSRWEHMEEYTMDLAKRMPDSLYDYRPTDSVMTFREQINHLIGHLQWVRLDFLLLDSDSIIALFDMHMFTPKYYKDHLKFSFQEIWKQVKKFDNDDLEEKKLFPPAGRELSRYELLYLLLDHTRNHTGQLMVYLRLNGIAPPKYQGW